MDYYGNIKCNNKKFQENLINYSNIELYGIQKVHAICLSITNQCNSRCTMCDYWKNEHIQSLTLNQITEWLPDFRKLSVKRIAITGGEPFMHPECKNIVKLLKENGFYVDIMTNGILLSRNESWLSEYADGITISLDGINSEQYYEIRGVDAYESIIRSIQTYCQQGITVRIRAVIQKRNFKNIRDFILLASRLNIVVTFQPIDIYSEISYGYMDKNASKRQASLKQNLLNETDLNIYFDFLESIKEEYNIYYNKGIVADDFEKLIDIGEYFKLALYDKWEIRKPQCNLSIVSPCIDYDGVLRPCFYLPGVKLLKEGLFETINSIMYKNVLKNIVSLEEPNCTHCVVAKVKDVDIGLNTHVDKTVIKN